MYSALLFVRHLFHCLFHQGSHQDFVSAQPFLKGCLDFLQNLQKGKAIVKYRTRSVLEII